MNVVVITGSQVQGITARLKDYFISFLPPSARVQTWTLPTDSPHFCAGCKTCFLVREDKCPHRAAIQPIWASMEAAEVLVFIYPVYVMGAPAQVKALLDHLGWAWMPHRPQPAMFFKRVIILA